MKCFTVFGLIALCAGLNGCAKAPAAAAAQNANGVAFASVTTAVSKLDTIMPDPATSLMSLSIDPDQVQTRTAGTTLATIWPDTSAWMADPRCSGGASDVHCSTGAVGLKFYMGFLLDGNARRDNGSDISVFGRIKSALAQGCAMAVAIPNTDGIPNVGTHSLTFDAATNTLLTTYCNFKASDLTSMLDQTASATVTATTDTTNYDRKLVLTLPGGGGTITTFLRLSATTFNFASFESTSRVLMALNRTTGDVRAEYVSRSSSGASGGGEWHRLFYDAAADDGVVVGSSFDFQATPSRSRILFTLHGKPQTAGSTVAFSAKILGFGLTSVDGAADPAVHNNNYKGCVSIDTGNISTDNSLACTLTGADTAGTAASTVGGVFNDLMTVVGTNGSELSGASITVETQTVPFTNATNILTAAVPHGT